MLRIGSTRTRWKCCSTPVYTDNLVNLSLGLPSENTLEAYISLATPHSHPCDPIHLIAIFQGVESGPSIGSVKIFLNHLQGAWRFRKPVHLQVSDVSELARKAIERCGGTIQTVYYNKLGLRALLMPEWFDKKGRLLPRPARPPPKKWDKYNTVGSLPPDRTIPSRIGAVSESKVLSA